MNRYSRDISTTFLSKRNVDYLCSRLSQYFQSITVDKFLRDNLDDHVGNFSTLIVHELMTSDPIPGVTMMQQVMGYNNQFLSDEIDFIMHNVLDPRDESAPTQYTIHDGLPTSRYGSSHHIKSSDDILKTWYCDSGRPVQSREDIAGDIGAETNQFYWGSQSSKNSLYTGITFADQSHLGTHNHVDMYNNSNKVALNNMRDSYAITPFGVSTPAADKRLLERNIFRYGNEIPRYETRLQRRNLDRDVSEGLRNAERGCMVHGHDMSSIHRRMDNNHTIATQYGPAPNKMDLSSYD